MAMCEMCGHDNQLQKAIVEGTMLNICNRCLRYGDAIEVKKPSTDVVNRRLAASSRYGRPKPKPRNLDSEDELVVEDYSIIVKQARQRMGMTQDDLAKAVAERSSVIQRVENGSLEPQLKLAKKLQQYLRITLIKKDQKPTPSTFEQSTSTSTGFTIGDIIKRKK